MEAENISYGEQLKLQREKENKERVSLGTKLLVPVLVYSLISTIFLYDNFSGILVPFEVFLTFGLIYYLLKKDGKRIKKSTYPFMIVMALIGISCVLTASTMIIWNHFINVCLLILFLLENYKDAKDWDFGLYVKEFLSTIGKGLANLFGVFIDGAAYAKAPKEKKPTKLTYVGIGVAISVPLVIVILVLLASADAVFMQGIRMILPEEITLELVVKVICFFAMVIMVTYGGLRGFYMPAKAMEKSQIKKQTHIVGITIVTPILLIYVVFCVIQIKYLFLGNGILPEGYTYASYAREGFFQLLFVSVLNLCLVLLFQWIFTESKVLDVTLVLVSAATYIMAASSFYRMLLYVKAYNFTRCRYYVLWMLVVIAVFLTGIVIRIVKKKFPLFKYGLWTFCVLFLVLSYSKPDYQVAKYNLTNTSRTGELDTYYLSEFMSLDAAPVIAQYEKTHDCNTYVDYETSPCASGNWVDDYYQNVGLDRVKKESIRKFNVSKLLAKKAFPGKREFVQYVYDDVDEPKVDADVSLSEVNINGYQVVFGKNDVYDLKIKKSDVIETLGEPSYDGLYDYAQAFYVMKYYDSVNEIELDFIYFETDEGEIINWIDAKDYYPEGM